MDWIELDVVDGWQERVLDALVERVGHEDLSLRGRVRRVTEEVLIHPVEVAITDARAEEDAPENPVFVRALLVQSSLGELGKRLAVMLPEKTYGHAAVRIALWAGDELFEELTEKQVASDRAIELLRDDIYKSEDEISPGPALDAYRERLVALDEWLAGGAAEDATREQRAVSAGLRKLVFRHARNDRYTQEV